MAIARLRGSAAGEHEEAAKRQKEIVEEALWSSWLKSLLESERGRPQGYSGRLRRSGVLVDRVTKTGRIKLQKPHERTPHAV